MQENHSGPFSPSEPKCAYAVVNKEFLVVLGFFVVFGFVFSIQSDFYILQLNSATIQSKLDSCLIFWFNSTEGMVHSFLLVLAV